MDPQDIEGRDFFVGLRGYDRDEVDQFLTELAAEHRSMLEELQAMRDRPEPEAELHDPFADLGENISAIVRTATQSAEAITADAETEAARMRSEADGEVAGWREEASADAATQRRLANEDAERIRSEVEAEVKALRLEAEEHVQRIELAAHEAAGRIRSEADEDAERLRREVAVEAEHGRRQRAEASAESERILAEAGAEANRIVEDAHDEQGRLLADVETIIATAEAEAEQRGLERANVMAETAIERLELASRRHEQLRERLTEASDEIQLSLIALGDPVDDPRKAIQAAIESTIPLDDAAAPVEP